MKFIFYAILILVFAGIIAGGIHLFKVAQKNKKEMAQYAQKEELNKHNLGRVLVVYYSLSGHTKEIAEKIKAQTNADIYEIKTAEEFKTNPLFYLKTKQQLKENRYPRLAGTLPDMGQYDLIFVGSPVWWYTISTPALSFLEQVDFKGKKVVPFSTQGSNYGSFFADFEKKARNAVILQSAAFNNLPAKYNQAVDNKITKLINSL